MPLFGKGKGNPELCTCSLEAKAHWVSSGFEKHEWQRDLDEKKRHDEVGNQISALTITSHESPRSLPLSPLFTSANDIMNSQPTSNEPDPSVLSDLPTSLQGITQLLLTDKTGKLVLAQPNAPPARSSTTINASQPAAAHSHPTPTSSRQQETSVPQNGEPRRPSKPTTQIAYQERALERLRDIEKGASDAISSLHIPANAPDGFDEEFIAKLDCAERTHTQLSYDIDRVRSTIDQVNQEKERVMEILSKLDNVISDLGNWVPQKAVMEKDLPAEDPETDPISIENGRYFDDPVNDLGISLQIMIMLAVTTHVSLVWQLPLSTGF
ncbi:hypothetical protein DL96DRAFT_1723159 [Flagelloscypha sp. PMI_526]|nr:hypothetical protein DL96DRAFT_1723159 [Flagelloscypha sp. PMI_526]